MHSIDQQTEQAFISWKNASYFLQKYYSKQYNFFFIDNKNKCLLSVKSVY